MEPLADHNLAPAAPPPTPRPKPHWRTALIVVGIIVVVLIALFAGLFWWGSRAIFDAKKVSDSFAGDMVSNHTAAAYQLTTPAFQQATSQAAFSNIVEDLGRAVTGQPTETSWNIQSYTGSGETAQIDYSVSGPKGSGNLNITLQQVNGKWLVNNVVVPLNIE